MSELSKEEILKLIPQQHPFRFIDEILSISDDEISATYTYKQDESFYEGHFPNRPVTPGVIILETAAQTGIVAFGLYLASKELEPAKMNEMLTLFTDANIEFTGMVKPGDRITVTAKKKFFRRLKIRSQVECKLDDGTVVLSGEISGMGVLNK